MGFFDDDSTFEISGSISNSISNILNGFQINGQTPVVHKSFKKTVIRIDENGNKTVEEYYSDGDDQVKQIEHVKKQCLYCDSMYENGEEECENCGAKLFKTLTD